ncbi:MAG: hypothetical protein NTW87_17695 [Planctomycetota bacterium]|nr:hypothetical protein [Planctomycetota bacterium]
MRSMLCIGVVLILVGTKGFAQDTNRTTQIEQAIQRIFDGFGQKVALQPRIDEVAAFGDEAVPLLIKTYDVTDDDKCWPLVSCLCAIGTDTSLQFVRQILKEPKKIWAVSSAIKDYPIAREDDITALLIEVVRVPRLGAKQGFKMNFDADDRLKKMIERKPSRAGQLVEALRDDDTVGAYGTPLGSILAFVSGYSNLWAVTMPGKDPVKITNKFWTEWWSRNKAKDVFGWLQESIAANGEEHKTTVLQRMRATKDRRALPYFLKALESPSPNVQYCGVAGLKSLEGTPLPQTGYTFETFLKEKDGLIMELKRKYEKAENGQPQVNGGQ